MTRDEKQILNITSKKCRILTAVSLCLMIGLALTKMVVANRASTWGQHLEAVKNQAEAVRQENLRLKMDLAAKGGGLTALQAIAEAKGFTREVEVKYFTPAQTVALSLP